MQYGVIVAGNVHVSSTGASGANKMGSLGWR